MTVKAEDLVRRQVRTMIRKALLVVATAASALVDSVAAGQMPKPGSEADV